MPSACTSRTVGRIAVAVLMFALLASCGSREPDGGEADKAESTQLDDLETATSTKGGADTSEDARPTGASFSCEGQTGGNDGNWYLVAVREAAHEGFDRVVFEFEAVDAEGTGVPRYDARLTQPPYREDPSDLPLGLDAPVAVEITFLNATGVDLSGTEPRIVYEGPKEIETDHSPVTDVVEAGDFENTMSWLLGLEGRRCFDVLALADPPRVVVDVDHEEP